MATQKFVARKQAPAAAKTAAKTPTGVTNQTARRRVIADDSKPMQGPNSLHAQEPTVGLPKIPKEHWNSQEQVEVFVRKAFKFTTDDHQVHDIAEGTQEVPREWLEHSYFMAHGVTETEQRKTAK